LRTHKLTFQGRWLSISLTALALLSFSPVFAQSLQAENNSRPNASRPETMKDLRQTKEEDSVRSSNQKMSSLTLDKETSDALQKWISTNRASGTSRLKKANPSADPFMNAMGTKDGGGGSDVGLDFKSAIDEAVQDLQRFFPSIYQDLLKQGLTKKIDNALLIVVDEALNVVVQELVQNSVAFFIPELQIILINGEKWKRLASLPNKNLKKSTALHEILGLLGIEKTGKYPISSKFLTGMNRITSQRTLADIGVIPKATYNCSSSADNMIGIGIEYQIILEQGASKVILSHYHLGEHSKRPIHYEVGRTYANQPAFVTSDQPLYHIQAILHEPEGPLQTEENLILNTEKLVMGHVLPDGRILPYRCRLM